eukprot:COSAG01_NODE_1217_length_11190_cov_69.180417_1_plen_133_part_00
MEITESFGKNEWLRFPGVYAYLGAYLAGLAQCQRGGGVDRGWRHDGEDGVGVRQVSGDTGSTQQAKQHPEHPGVSLRVITVLFSGRVCAFLCSWLSPRVKAGHRHSRSASTERGVLYLLRHRIQRSRSQNRR